MSGDETLFGPGIRVQPNGPYVVRQTPLVRRHAARAENGDPAAAPPTETVTTSEPYSLCRCGLSAAKPFCDGSHRRTPFDGTETAPARRDVPRPNADRSQARSELPREIEVVADGPLRVTGSVIVERSDGSAQEFRNRVSLCRCGASKNKPLCDGSHRDVGFRDGNSDGDSDGDSDV